MTWPLSSGAKHRRYYDRGGITCELTGRAAMAHELEVDVELRAQWGHP